MGTNQKRVESREKSDNAVALPPAMVGMLAVGAFVVFAQIFMIAPILPALSQAFSTTPEKIGLAIPAYLIPHGAMTLVWGPISDRVGRRPVILASVAVFSLLVAATAFTTTEGSFMTMRVLTAFAASGLVPIALALVGDLVPYERRGQALGWLFGGMAGGMAFGAAGGALAEPHIGWRGLFIAAAAAGILWVGAVIVLRALPVTPRDLGASLGKAFVGYFSLLRIARARRTYGFVFLNAAIQSGMYSWAALYLHQHFGMGEVQIGLTLLGYGLPGFFLGPVIGRAVDRFGRSRVVPAGIALTAACGIALALPLPVIGIQAAIILLSLGYDMTQPPLAGIVTDLGVARGQAMGLNAFTLFTGFGIGALIFQMVLAYGFTTAFASFGIFAAIAAVVALRLFRSEKPDPTAPPSH